MKKLESTEYMYASTRLRALEKHMIGRERLEVLLSCRTGDEVMARLSEYGMAPPEAAGAVSEREAMLLAALRDAYAEVEAAVPDGRPYRAFRYPYDCNNLKVAVKCGIRGIENPAGEGLLFDFGTVPAERVEAIVRDGKGLDAYPPAMAAAVKEARRAFDETGDPRRIDAVLDRACYADMLTTLSALGDPAVLGWIRMRIDLMNILMTLRILRMGRGDAGAAFLSDTLLPGGTLDEAFFAGAYAAGEAGLMAALIPTPYAALARVEGDEPSLAMLEKLADDLWMERVRADARTPFGAPVAAGYLVGWETAVKNVRIVLSAKDADLPEERVRERIRVSYV